MNLRWLLQVPLLGLLLCLPLLVNASGPMPSGSVNVTAEVCPTGVPPTITSPANGSVVGSSALTVTGTGNADEVLTIFRNGNNAGSTVADGSGNWTINITLVAGSNLLSAVNCVGQDSITVTYVPPPTPTPSPTPTPGPTNPPTNPPTATPVPTIAPTATPGGPGITVPPRGTHPPANPGNYQPPVPPRPIPPGNYIITTLQSVINAQVGGTALLYFTIHNGRAPYDVTVHWDDNTVDQARVLQRGDVSLAHTFKTPGNHRVVVEIRDADGKISTLSFVVRVSGESPVVVTQHTGKPTQSLLIMLGLELLFLVIVFILWERYHRQHVHAQDLADEVS